MTTPEIAQLVQLARRALRQTANPLLAADLLEEAIGQLEGRLVHLDDEPTRPRAVDPHTRPTLTADALEVWS